MSARKRARTSESARSLTHQPEQRVSSGTAPPSGWCTLPTELLHRATALLLGASAASLPLDLQLLLRLSSVCGVWRGAVYSSSTHVDFWRCVTTVSVVRRDWGGEFAIAGQWLSSGPAALSSLRNVHSLLLDFGQRRSLHDVPATIESLALFTRLVSVHIDLTAAFSLEAGTAVFRKAQAAVDAALAAIARRSNQLISLALHCYCGTKYGEPSDNVRPTFDVLRRLCSSSVQQLSLSAGDLTMLAWGDDPSHTGGWKAHNVRSFVVTPRISYIYFDEPCVVLALTVCFPSLTHLHVKDNRGAEGMDSLLGSQLTFLRFPSTALYDLLLVAKHCSALVSLHTYLCRGCVVQSQSPRRPHRASVRLPHRLRVT